MHTVSGRANVHRFVRYSDLAYPSFRRALWPWLSHAMFISLLPGDQKCAISAMWSRITHRVLHDIMPADHITRIDRPSTYR
jgi:hypothetical protein